MIVRYSDWEQRFNEFLIAQRDVPFEWGVSDCCLFCADGIQAMTGIDLLASYRGTYFSLEDVARIAPQGIGTLASEILGDPKHVNQAMRGDVVMVIDEHYGPALGLMTAHRGVFKTHKGLALIHRSQLTEFAWSV